MTRVEKFNQPRYRWVGLAFLCVALLAVSMNNTILNVSMPVIATALDASTSDLQWIENSYILGFSALLLSAGILGDRYGRKRFLMGGIVAFGISSIIAMMARSTEMVIVARALQGGGAAFIMPSTLSMISSMFREPGDRTKAIAIWSATFGVGLGIGPIVGGALLELQWFNWQDVFLVNLPLGLIVLIGGTFFIPESRHPQDTRLDLLGVVLSFIGLFALVYAIIATGEHGWGAPIVLAGYGMAAFFLGVFLWWERRTPNAMLPLELFRNPSFIVVSVSMMILDFGLSGLFFFLPLFMQGIQNYTPLDTGLLLLPQAVISVLVSWNSHHIIRWIGVRGTMVGGLILIVAGMALMTLTLQTDTPLGLLLIGLILTTAGADSAMPAGTVSIMRLVPEETAGVGAAMHEMTFQIGSVLGIAVLGAILNRVYLNDVASLAEQLPPDIMASISNSIFSAHKVLDGSADLIQAVDNAFMNGLRYVFAFSTGIFSVLAILVRVYMPRNIQQAESSMSEIRDM